VWVFWGGFFRWVYPNGGFFGGYVPGCLNPVMNTTPGTWTNGQHYWLTVSRWKKVNIRLPRDVHKTFEAETETRHCSFQDVK